MAWKNSLAVRIMDYLEQQPGSTVHEIGVALAHLNTKSVYRTLARLREKGLTHAVAVQGEPIGIWSRRWFLTQPRRIDTSATMLPAEFHDNWTPGVWVHPYRARKLGLTRAA